MKNGQDAQLLQRDRAVGCVSCNWHPISYRFGVIAAYCSNFAPTRSLRL